MAEYWRILVHRTNHKYFATIVSIRTVLNLVAVFLLGDEGEGGIDIGPKKDPLHLRDTHP